MKRSGFDGDPACGFLAPNLLPDLLPKYMVLVGTRWDLLGRTDSSAVPTSTNSHQHNQDSNSLGGTKFPQVRGLCSPISSAKSGYECLVSESGRGQGCSSEAVLRPSCSSGAVPVAHSPLGFCLVAGSNPVSPTTCTERGAPSGAPFRLLGDMCGTRAPGAVTSAFRGVSACTITTLGCLGEEWTRADSPGQV